MAAAVFVGSASLHPSTASAWAWKDTCTSFTFNQTGVRTVVRPIVYLGVLPHAGSTAEYVIFAASGIPTNQAMALTNTGFPVPTYGCHATLQISNPGPVVSCGISAPTTGANTFSCSGNQSTKIIKDDDDIAGKIAIPQGPIPGDSISSRRPTVGHRALRVSHLPGGGWKAKNSIAPFGLAGRLMNSDTLPASCHARPAKEVAPKLVNSELVTRRGGAEGIGAVVGTYAHAAEAKQTVADALSAHSIHCLARLLTSNHLHTSVATQSLLTAPLGGDVTGARLVITRHVNGHVSAVDYLDVLGLSRGKQDAVVMLESTGTPMSVAAESGALRALRIS